MQLAAGKTPPRRRHVRLPVRRDQHGHLPDAGRASSQPSTRKPAKKAPSKRVTIQESSGRLDPDSLEALRECLTRSNFTRKCWDEVGSSGR
jgi:hypothetical protein